MIKRATNGLHIYDFLLRLFGSHKIKQYLSTLPALEIHFDHFHKFLQFSSNRFVVDEQEKNMQGSVTNWIRFAEITEIMCIVIHVS